jgi:hypothetical protein
MGCSSTSPASPTSCSCNRAAMLAPIWTPGVLAGTYGVGALVQVPACRTIMSLSDSRDCRWPSKRRTASKAPRANPSEVPCLPAYPPRPPHPVLFLTRPSLTQRPATFIRVSESPANQVRASGCRQRTFRDFRLNVASNVASSTVRRSGASIRVHTEGFFFSFNDIALHRIAIAREEVEMRINATR